MGRLELSVLSQKKLTRVVSGREREAEVNGSSAQKVNRISWANFVSRELRHSSPVSGQCQENYRQIIAKIIATKLSV